MNKAHYIIFHPENKRQLSKVYAVAIVNHVLQTNWYGSIYIDKVGVGNEDPYVFNEPWLYSYCHASQLRRNIRKDSFLQVESKIIFASGQEAEKGKLCIDTIFLVGAVQMWGKKPLKLPLKYQFHYNNNMSDLWKRHLRYPFKGYHNKVSHTYEASLWSEFKNDFSFFPLDENNNRMSISFEELPTNILTKIKSKLKGKYPILLTDIEIDILMDLVESGTKTKVLKIINRLKE